ncbi:MAG: hypothetical protein J3K34DRAFT_503568 [Monoraphidium minutum]|nr:MAG: hypothetical protein J3K34DRAFT_503568 [Monoraphidium minutum]
MLWWPPGIQGTKPKGEGAARMQQRRKSARHAMAHASGFAPAGVKGYRAPRWQCSCAAPRKWGGGEGGGAGVQPPGSPFSAEQSAREPSLGPAAARRRGARRTWAEGGSNGALTRAFGAQVLAVIVQYSIVQVATGGAPCARARSALRRCRRPPLPPAPAPRRRATAARAARAGRASGGARARRWARPRRRPRQSRAPLRSRRAGRPRRASRRRRRRPQRGWRRATAPAARRRGAARPAARRAPRARRTRRGSPFAVAWVWLLGGLGAGRKAVSKEARGRVAGGASGGDARASCRGRWSGGGLMSGRCSCTVFCGFLRVAPPGCAIKGRSSRGHSCVVIAQSGRSSYPEAASNYE